MACAQLIAIVRWEWAEDLAKSVFMMALLCMLKAEAVLIEDQIRLALREAVSVSPRVLCSAFLTETGERWENGFAMLVRKCSFETPANACAEPRPNAPSPEFLPVCAILPARLLHRRKSVLNDRLREQTISVSAYSQPASHA